MSLRSREVYRARIDDERIEKARRMALSSIHVNHPSVAFRHMRERLFLRFAPERYAGGARYARAGSPASEGAHDFSLEPRPPPRLHPLPPRLPPGAGGSAGVRGGGVDGDFAGRR